MHLGKLDKCPYLDLRKIGLISKKNEEKNSMKACQFFQNAHTHTYKHTQTLHIHTYTHKHTGFIEAPQELNTKLSFLACLGHKSAHFCYT